MFALSDIYEPITAEPFINNEAYIEIKPCEELKPYIRCFWGTIKPHARNTNFQMKSGLVTPDTCMDIIFDIDINNNKLDDLFCGINDTSFVTKGQRESSTTSCFAIRFYFWAVPLFSDETMNNALNAFTETGAYFKNIRRDFENILIEASSIQDRIAKAEQYFLKKLNLNRQNNNVMNAVYKIMKSRGTSSILEISEFGAVSKRQLERLFLEYVGVSPKKLSGLIRYQYLWQDILKDKNGDMQDFVCKYGYTDQAHLLKDFKKYHTMTPSEAIKLAYR
ncbi:helix-turn-helix domain-containing protein [Clostridium hydrogenum]|uniref:helix-turn-helix domain-containing protein n=1 Tax=Clostridium hydrogenum TaxID=2855764 RepID=UPI001F2F9694|nr:helix-turn-helix domain-containing protein [Clostridium hydrogenum]